MIKYKIDVILTLCCVLVGMTVSCNSRQVVPHTLGIEVEPMLYFPDKEPGYSLGVSACYAGVIDGQLLIAGGCNFPDKPAVDGGKKKYYKGIYAATITNESALQWRKVGELPVAAAYGASISLPGELICAGGMNEHGSLTSVLRLSLSGDKQSVHIDTLTSLPAPMDNLAGAKSGRYIVVAGGNVNGKPSNSLYSFSLDSLVGCWTEALPYPGSPRVQPVCVGQYRGESFVYLLGGFSPSFDGQSATVSTDGYCYSLQSRQWTHIPATVDSNCQQIALGGGVGIALNDSLILCTGGVNKDVFWAALQRDQLLKEAVAANNSTLIDSLRIVSRTYMTQPATWYRFNDKVLLYHSSKGIWTELESYPELARAGAALVGSDNVLFSIAGELKPGIRTPEIVRIIIEEK